MSDPVRPHRRQPTRLPHLWDSPGKNTGVGCHFLLQCMKVKSESEAAQSCPTLSDPMDCSLRSSSHGIFQARVLEWGAIAFSHMKCYEWFKCSVWLGLKSMLCISINNEWAGMAVTLELLIFPNQALGKAVVASAFGSGWAVPCFLLRCLLYLARLDSILKAEFLPLRNVYS